ncbi:hypothetical protein PLESTB_000701000 [Pleodorina starrii]|uniref:Uncharacterized protein n=1 Tax=Pleodorina starrii TaxID=330485 RepID=A0A9W6BJR8_9CHLO|nr:hypothetical protein PLESTM_001215700 [Pleodorina starrii]GLC53035.1 hypothetical protein PLESTB_000701000 [Pleodorina starrii]
MALVPYRVSGPAADQRAAERLLQLPGGITLRLTQWPAASGAAAPPPLAPTGHVTASPSAGHAPGPHQQQHLQRKLEQPDHHHHPQQLQQQNQQQEQRGPQLSSLANVGLVVWQAGFLLADFLLRGAPEAAIHQHRRGGGGGGGGGGAGTSGVADWRSLTVVDLGTGSGVVGIALALAGARVFLTDLPHVVPLAAANVAANCDPRVTRTVVCAYRWGEDSAEGGGGGGAAASAPASSPLAGIEPDVITAADVLYHEELLAPLMAALARLSAPHTVSYVSYRVRQGREVGAFLALAEAAGFAAEEVPEAALHEEYRRRGGGGGGGAGQGLGGSMCGGNGSSDEEEGMGQSGVVAIECVGSDRRWPPGMYGILRLCRRDGVAPPSPQTAAAAAAVATSARLGGGATGICS